MGADDLGKEPSQGIRFNGRADFYHELMEKYFEATARRAGTPLINGRDLMKIFGLEPSPHLGRVLKATEELQMAGALSDRRSAWRAVPRPLYRPS